MTIRPALSMETSIWGEFSVGGRDVNTNASGIGNGNQEWH
jgi:hypothetical protein